MRPGLISVSAGLVALESRGGLAGSLAVGPSRRDFPCALFGRGRGQATCRPTIGSRFRWEKPAVLAARSVFSPPFGRTGAVILKTIVRTRRALRQGATGNAAGGRRALPFGNPRCDRCTIFGRPFVASSLHWHPSHPLGTPKGARPLAAQGTACDALAVTPND